MKECEYWILTEDGKLEKVRGEITEPEYYDYDCNYD